MGSLIMILDNVQSGQYVSEPFGTFKPQRNNEIILASMGLFAAFVIVLLRLIDRNLDFVMLALCLGALLLAPVLIAAVRGAFFPLEAIYFCLPLYAYVYLVKPTVRLMSEDQFVSGEQDLTWAMSVAIVGLLAFYMGYYSKAGTKIADHVPAMADEVSSHRLRVLAWTFIAIGAVGLWAYMETSGGWREFWSKPHGLGGKTEHTTAYVYQLPELMIVGFFLIVYDAMTQPRLDAAAWGRILIASIGGIGVYTLLWSRRTFILWAMITVFILYFLRKRKFPNVMTLLLFATLVSAAVVVALAYRPYLHLGSSAEELASVDPLEHTLPTASQEGDEFDSFLAIVDLYPAYIPYDYFTIYARIPLHPIPRLLWPDKPPLFVSSWDAFLYQSRIGWGASESLLGDLYIQMGLLGVVIGMVAAGVLWRFFFAYLQKAPTSGFMQLFYAVAIGNVPTFVVQSAISAFWKWMPLIMPSVVFAYWVLRKKA